MLETTQSSSKHVAKRLKEQDLVVLKYDTVQVLER